MVVYLTLGKLEVVLLMCCSPLGGIANLLWRIAAIKGRLHQQNQSRSNAVDAIPSYVVSVNMKFFGRDLCAGRDRIMNCMWLRAVRAIASVFNSVGLFVSMSVLVIIFRWLRLSAEAK